MNDRQEEFKIAIPAREEKQSSARQNEDVFTLSLAESAFTPFKEQKDNGNDESRLLKLYNEKPVYLYLQGEKKEKNKNNKQYLAQLTILINKITEWCNSNNINDAAQSFKQFISDVFPDDPSTSKAAKQPKEYFESIKKNIEKIYLSLSNDLKSASHKSTVLKNLLQEGLNVCGPGIYQHIQNAAFQLADADTLNNWLAEFRMQIIKQLSSEHIMEKGINPNYQIHVEIVFSKYAKKQGYSPKTESKFIDHFETNAEIEHKNKRKFIVNFEKRYQLRSIAENVETCFYNKCVDEFKKQGLAIEKDGFISTKNEVSISDIAELLWTSAELKKRDAVYFVRNAQGDKARFDGKLFKQLFYQYCKQENVLVDKASWHVQELGGGSKLIHCKDTRYLNVSWLESKGDCIIQADDLEADHLIQYFVYSLSMFEREDAFHLLPSEQTIYSLNDKQWVLFINALLKNDSSLHGSLMMDILQKNPIRFAQVLIAMKERDWDSYAQFFREAIPGHYMYFNANHPLRPNLVKALEYMKKESSDELLDQLDIILTSFMRDAECKDSSFRYSDLIKTPNEKISKHSQLLYKSYFEKLFPHSVLTEEEAKNFDYAKAFKRADEQSINNLTIEQRTLSRLIKDGDLDAISKVNVTHLLVNSNGNSYVDIDSLHELAAKSKITNLEDLFVMDSNDNYLIWWMRELHHQKLLHYFYQKAHAKYDINLLHHDINFKINIGRSWPLLNWAVALDQVNAIQGLLQYKDIDVPHAALTTAEEGLNTLKILCAHQEIDLNFASRTGATMLHQAARYGHLDIVRYLCMQSGININAVDKQGFTPLEYAVQKGYWEIAKFFCMQSKIEFDKNLFNVFFRYKPEGLAEFLSLLWSQDKAALSRLLKENDFNYILLSPEHPHHDKLIAVFQSLKDKNKQLFDILQTICNNANQTRRQLKFEIETNVISERSQKAAYKIYLERFYPSLKPRENEELNFDYAKALGEAEKESLKGLSDDDKNLLSWIKAGDIQSIKNAKTPIKSLFNQDYYGCNFITWLARLKQQKLFDYFYEKAKEFYDMNELKKNINLHAGPDGTPLLFWAVSFNQPEIIAALLNIDGIEIGTAELTVAVKGGLSRVVKQLCAQNVKEKTKTGWVALHAAAQLGDLDIMRLLLTQKAMNVDVVTIDGCTVLHIAAQRGDLDMVRFLLAQPCIDVNAAYSGGLTAFHIAAQRGDLDLIQLLLAHQSTDMTVFTNNRDTAIDIALQNGHENTVRHLLAQEKIIGYKTTNQDEIRKMLEKVIHKWADDNIKNQINPFFPLAEYFVNKRKQSSFRQPPFHIFLYTNKIIENSKNESDVCEVINSIRSSSSLTTNYAIALKNTHERITQSIKTNNIKASATQAVSSNNVSENKKDNGDKEDKTKYLVSQSVNSLFPIETRSTQRLSSAYADPGDDVGTNSPNNRG